MEESEVLVRVEGLSKKFCKDLKTSLKYGLNDLFSNLKGNKEPRRLREKEFWALRDINFELRRGECLGLIGHNGAGKSTLLKILNGLIKPDEGKVTMRGRVGALIELGAGFNPVLTGRENVYNNGAILGFTRREIEEKMEDIIDFAEIREFMDMPVQNYSSGMKVRLGFAVAAQMEPDVLIIDEVLAVGDLGFRMKCLTKIGSLLSKTAVIFVSHSMPQVSRVGNKILLLNKGEELVYHTDVSLGIEKYYNLFGETDKVISGNGKIDLVDFEVFNKDYQNVEKKKNNFILRYYEDYIFRLKLNVKDGANNYDVHYSIIDKDSKIVATIYSYISREPFSNRGIVEIDMSLEKILLGQGIYTVGIALNEVRPNKASGEVFLYNSNVANLKIIGVSPGVAPIQLKGEWNETKRI